MCMMIISIHQNNLLNPSDIYESYNTVIADEFNFPYFLATNITRKLNIVMKKIELCMSCFHYQFLFLQNDQEELNKLATPGVL